MYDFHHNILILKTTSAEAWTTITITVPKNSLRQVKVKSFEEKEPYVYFKQIVQLKKALATSEI